MKKVVFVLGLILVVMTGRTQSFEGTIRWKMNMEITDPETKAKMEEAKKKAADPANQAKMKEMEAKMNDPQFKAMLDSNPQMKAQMDAMMKMMAGADMTAMMPTAIVMKLKGSNSLTAIEGGIMDNNEVLHIADKDVTYSISHPAKTYTVMKNNSTTPEKTPKITKTPETQKILGHVCTKYVIETTGPDGKPVKTNYWATTEIKDIDLKELAKQQVGREQSFVYAEIDGVPLKIEVGMPQGNLIMECTEFKKESVPASSFTLPAGYTETKI